MLDTTDSLFLKHLVLGLFSEMARLTHRILAKSGTYRYKLDSIKRVNGFKRSLINHQGHSARQNEFNSLPDSPAAGGGKLKRTGAAMLISSMEA